VKTVITRISEGSKIVLIGDPAQIDNPYVDSRSNGLVYCHNRMKGQALAAHVKLTKGERSKLAELAADLLPHPPIVRVDARAEGEGHHRREIAERGNVEREHAPTSGEDENQ
jgi:hypothetical protein